MISDREERALKLAHDGDDGPAANISTELGRLFEEALRCLKSTDLTGANAALKKAHAEVALLHGAAKTTGQAAPGARQTEKRGRDRG